MNSLILNLFYWAYNLKRMSIKQIDGYIVFLNKVLGHGSFGNVYKGIIEETNEEVAIKMIPKERSKSFHNAVDSK